MPPIRQKSGCEYVQGVLERGGDPARSGNFPQVVEAESFFRAENDSAIRRPETPVDASRIGQGLSRTARSFNLLELALGSECDKAAVRRPKRNAFRAFS